MSTRCGGTSSAREATAEVQELCDKVKEHVEIKAERKFTIFKAVSMTSQVVAGTNYFVKIDIGNEEFAHARIFVPLPCNGSEPELANCLLGKTKDDLLEYF